MNREQACKIASEAYGKNTLLMYDVILIDIDRQAKKGYFSTVIELNIPVNRSEIFEKLVREGYDVSIHPRNSELRVSWGKKK